jgi:hypothetical protein
MTNSLGTLALAGLLLLGNVAQAQTFTIATYPSAGGFSQGFAVGDLNNDAQPDVAAVSYDSNSLDILFNNGSGALTSRNYYLVSHPGGMAIGDINGDSRPDVAVAGNNLRVLLNSSGGNFVSYASYFSAAGPEVELADLNGDGWLDALTCNSYTSEAFVLLNDGLGAFGAPQPYATGSGTGPTKAVAADVNADGRLDIVTVNSNNNTYGVLLNVNNQGFAPAVSYPSGTVGSGSLQYVVVRDVNRDGRPDILGTGFLNGLDIRVLLNTGGGVFGPATGYFSGSGHAVDIAVGDVTGDGNNDLVTANYNFGNSSVSVLPGSGTGTFGSALVYQLGGTNATRNVGLADFNSDGRLDIATLNTASGRYGLSTISVLLNTTPLAARATLPGTSATLHPNPAGAATTLRVAGLPAAVAQVQATLFDATGRAVGQQQLATTQGTAHAEVPTAGLAAGLYVLRLLAYTAQGQPAGSLPTQRLSVR